MVEDPRELARTARHQEFMVADRLALAAEQVEDDARVALDYAQENMNLPCELVNAAAVAACGSDDWAEAVGNPEFDEAYTLFASANTVADKAHTVWRVARLHAEECNVLSTAAAYAFVNRRDSQVMR